MPHSRTDDLIALVGRVLLCWIFIRAGYAKFSAPTGFADAMRAAGMPYPEAFPYLAIAIELVGGTLLLVGLMVRPLSLLLALFTIVAIAIAHQYWNYPLDRQLSLANPNQANHFYKNLAIVGGFLTLYAMGGVRFSLDALFGRKPPAGAGTQA